VGEERHCGYGSSATEELISTVCTYFVVLGSEGKLGVMVSVFMDPKGQELIWSYTLQVKSFNPLVSCVS
jgi:hypothetical protein